MPFELIYIRLENAPGFLIYFSSVLTVFGNCCIPYFYIQVSLRPASIKCSNWSLLVQVLAASGGRSSLPSAGNAAEYRQCLFFELHFLTIAFSF